MGQLRRRPERRPLSILFAFVDHWEPMQLEGDPAELQIERAARWIEGYERLCEGHGDRLGRPPQHTYFFPQEQYSPALVGPLAEHCRRGYGEVEVHIHHDDDTAEGFLEKIGKFKEQLRGHGLLPTDTADGMVKYGFIHGNWALDNSRADGRWCGLNNEITLLRETGCYADFTMPSAPADCQTRKINSIYFADDDPQRPKSHDTGRDIVFGGRDSGDLLLIQGPLALNLRSRKRGVIPRIENGDIHDTSRFTRSRMALWVSQRICVRGREDTVFVKVHTHGLKTRQTGYLLGDEMSRGFDTLEREFNDGDRYRLFYVNAREMANVVLAFNDGIDSPPEQLFDYRLNIT
jgi:hypothetical protein